MIKEKCYAKVNLVLKVLSKRSDGYHELQSLMAPVGLYDTIKMKKISAKKVIIKGMNIPNNIMERACMHLIDKYNLLGVYIKIKKRIPLESGLGGGSADCAGVLRGMNRLYNLNLSLDDLAQIAQTIGADVPFCIYNKAAWVHGFGEKISFLKKPFSFPICIVKPPYGLSTKEVFANFANFSLPAEEKEITSLNELHKMMTNDLFPVAKKKEELLNELYLKLKNDDIKAYLTGSGSALFILGNSYTKFKLVAKKYEKENSIYYTKVKDKMI